MTFTRPAPVYGVVRKKKENKISAGTKAYLVQHLVANQMPLGNPQQDLSAATLPLSQQQRFRTIVPLTVDTEHSLCGW